MSSVFDMVAAESFLKNSKGMIGKDKESPIRHVLSAALADMYPGKNKPWWVLWHAKGAERTIVSKHGDKQKKGFIDTLVGSTAIEYEKDLSSATLFSHGLEQLREYCSGLINAGIPRGIIVGVLSDTIHWYAYRIKDVLPLSPGETLYGAHNITLDEIDRVDLMAAGPREAANLDRFLSKHLGRIGARVLAADTLADDLGFQSVFCSDHLADIEIVVDSAFKSNPVYATLISKVWTDFVSYLGGSGVGDEFEKETYIGELYILTLAKLLCANVISDKALISNDEEIFSILDGSFFQNRGYTNLVEYDYFGWLNKNEHVKALLSVAQQIQEDLAAYDFSTAPSEDLFGVLMAQLAKRSQRLLLGQEWTPTWLARSLVENVMRRLPDDQEPRFVDTCCGSGSMVVETVKQTILRFEKSGMTPNSENVSKLAQTITGFDIDPLAVMLAKVSWILAAKSWLDSAGSFDVAIPIYHADSLFASTPVTKRIDDDGTEQHELNLGGNKVSLPGFLVSVDCAQLFDAIISTSYSVAMQAAATTPPFDFSGLPETILNNSCEKTGIHLTSEKKTLAAGFIEALLTTLEALQRTGRNGIWAFVLGNSYRPGLLSGKFNGLVTNPPWLAMSKVANNPYKETLGVMAEKLGIKPPGASHLHVELATIFLLHAIYRYLQDGAIIGCVLPESITSAHHHNPFRLGAYRSAPRPVPFVPNELWWVEKGTFKNEAIVLFGTKTSSRTAQSQIEGHVALPGNFAASSVHVLIQGNRTAWSDKQAASLGTGFFTPALFRQGADIFPRTAIFHTVTQNGDRIDISPVDSPSSPLAYLVKDAKNFKDFTISATGVDPKFFFDVLMSNHLTPFDLITPAKGFLPINNDSNTWTPVTNPIISASGTSTIRAFTKFFTVAGGDSQTFFNTIDTPRRKLRCQTFPDEGWLVVMGAGGEVVCAAYKDLNSFDQTRLIIDQTLYWVVVPDENEAIYITGLLNSEAVNLVIRQFQPRGQFGARHVHTLPLGVTPKYDPLNAGHADVVTHTKTLLAQWHADQGNNPCVYQSLLNPNNNLAARRRRLRERLKLMEGYASYDLTCRSLYAV